MSVKHLYRADNPVTSKEAAESFEESGSRAEHMQIVKEAVFAHPGLTSSELPKYTSLDQYQVRRRLSDLKNEHWIKQGEPRKCTVAKRRMVPWFPVDDQERALLLFEALPLEKKLERLGFEDLPEYYDGDHWVGFREGYYTRHPRACFVSGLTTDLHLHHITYIRLGRELDEDVVPVHKFWHSYIHRLVNEHKVELSRAHIVAQECYRAVNFSKVKLFSA